VDLDGSDVFLTDSFNTGRFFSREEEQDVLRARAVYIETAGGDWKYRSG